VPLPAATGAVVELTVAASYVLLVSVKEYEVVLAAADAADEPESLAAAKDDVARTVMAATWARTCAIFMIVSVEREERVLSVAELVLLVTERSKLKSERKRTLMQAVDFRT
jgi:hypothetical protein